MSILGLNTGERPDGDPAGFMRREKLTYTLLLEADSVARLYKARGLPTFYVIGPDGKILMARSGFSEATERRMRAQVQEALDALDKARGVAPS